MTVDSFKFLPRIIAAIYETSEREPDLPIPWTPLARPLSECKFGLVTTGGLFHKGCDDPFDLAREQEEPTWGDPSFRSIPSDIQQADLGVSHLHINPQAVLEDINILLPLQRFQELAENGKVGEIAQTHFSFMGYQGYPSDATAWQNTYGPQVAKKLIEQDVNCVLLTPS